MQILRRLFARLPGPVEAQKNPQSNTGCHQYGNEQEIVDPDACFLISEVEEAEAIVGGLFKRRFHTDEFPENPHHYVAFVQYRDGTLRPVGYVHYTLMDESALCGGLVIDNRQFRLLPKDVRAYLHEKGGIAELLLRQTFSRLPSQVCAIWGHVGNLQSERVCLRVGFQRTPEQYLLVVWRHDGITSAEKERLIKKVAAIGPF